MFIVYFISVSTVGAWVTDWTNDSLFGDGFHLVGIGSSEYADAEYEYTKAETSVEAFEATAEEKGISPADAKDLTARAELLDDEGKVEEEFTVDYEAYTAALSALRKEAPDPADFGVWVPGIPVLVGRGLEAINAADWISSLVLDGIIAGVGSVLGFVPQMLVLFFFQHSLRRADMARVAFNMDGYSASSDFPKILYSHAYRHRSAAFPASWQAAQSRISATGA